MRSVMEVKDNAVYIIYAISFLDLCAVGLIFPVLSPYIRSLGVSHLNVGLLSSVYSALQVLSGPIIGSWSDVRGRKSVFLITLLCSSICYLLLGFASSIITIFCLRLLLGIVKHTQTLNKAIVGDLMKTNEVSKIYGKTMAFGSLGFVIGPVIGGHLADLQNGFMYVCTLTSILFIIIMALVLFLPEAKKRKTNKNDKMLKTISQEFKKSIVDIRKVNWRIHWLSFTLKFLFILSTTTFFMNQSLYLKEKFNLPQKYVGYLIAFASIVGVVTSFFMDAITKRFYRNDIDCMQRSSHFFIVLTACYAGFYLAPNYYILAVIVLPFGAANSVLRIVTMEITFKKCKDGDRGTLAGASDSIMSIGRFAAPLLSGVIGDLFSQNAVMLNAMLSSMIGACICFWLLHKQRSSSTKIKRKME